MRFLWFILLSASILSGCNSDPRCRRETALLRAEILDLEDKLALATTRPRTTKRRMARSNQNVIEVVDSYPMANEVIYDSDELYLDGQVFQEGYIVENGPLEVQHQIAPQAAGSSFDNTDILPVEISEPTASPAIDKQDLETILPDQGRESILTEPESEALPKPNESKARPSPSMPGDIEIELALEEPESSSVNNQLATSSAIARIIVNRDGSHGQNIDGKHGDEGLNLLIQPQSRDGSVVLEPGTLSVQLFDPTLPSNQRLVGRWSFLPEETKLFFARDRHDGEGILLHLPWEQNRPKNQRLEVAVSFTTTDGRELSTSSKLMIDPPAANYSVDDPQIAGWTQRDTRWEIGANQNNSSAADNSNTKRRLKALPVSSTKTVKPPSRWRPVR